MLVLSLESSCDDTAAAVVRNGREVLSNVVASQVAEHVLYGGVVPEIASRRHCEAVSGVVTEALSRAGVTLDDIDVLAVTNAPGLIGALLVGVSFMKGLSFTSGKPLVPVHHLRSHVAANYLCHAELEPPFLSLVVSGGHTHLMMVNDYTDYKIIGRTRDDAAGETLDKAARAMGLDYPGGLNLDRASVNGNPHAYQFPKPHVDSSPYDFSFSGLKTYVINLIHNMEQKGETPDIADLGASYMLAVASCLTERVEKAIDEFHPQRFAVAGGVSANSVLRRELTLLCERKNVKLYMPELSLCGDNGAMVGAQGYYEYISGTRSDLTLNAFATKEISL